jgi:hypothetical protein
VRKIIVPLFLLVGTFANASIYLGAGVGGATSGRSNLALVVSLDSSDASMSGYISGVQTAYYYQSDYFLSYNKKMISGEFWWGPMNGFFGGGVFYSERGMRAATSGAVSENSSDVVLGPTINIKWGVLGSWFIAIDAIYGIRDLGHHLSMTFQDVELLSTGLDF